MQGPRTLPIGSLKHKSTVSSYNFFSINTRLKYTKIGFIREEFLKVKNLPSLKGVFAKKIKGGMD